MAQTYSQFIQENPDMVQQAAGQMQSAPMPMAPPAQPAPPPQNVPPPAAGGAPPPAAGGVAPVTPDPNAGKPSIADQVASGASVAQSAGGNATQGHMQDKSTIQDIASIFKMFMGGG